MRSPPSLDFNPRTPLQSAIGPRRATTAPKQNFNPRTPLQSAIKLNQLAVPGLLISIHALHYRVRYKIDFSSRCSSLFQSTHSITECDTRSPIGWVTRRYFNPRTPLQSAITTNGPVTTTIIISIHALHYRVRFPKISPVVSSTFISIHALHYRVRWYGRGLP